MPLLQRVCVVVREKFITVVGIFHLPHEAESIKAIKALLGPSFAQFLHRLSVASVHLSPNLSQLHRFKAAIILQNIQDGTTRHAPVLLGIANQQYATSSFLANSKTLASDCVPASPASSIRMTLPRLLPAGPHRREVFAPCRQNRSPFPARRHAMPEPWVQMQSVVCLVPPRRLRIHAEYVSCPSRPCPAASSPESDLLKVAQLLLFGPHSDSA